MPKPIIAFVLASAVLVPTLSFAQAAAPVAAPDVQASQEPRPEDNVVRLSPRTRVEPLAVAVPTIPGNAIGPFLSQPLVVEADGLSSLPRIVGTEDDRVIVGAGTGAYVAGLPRDGATLWQIFRPGTPLRDPDTGSILGYEAIHVGEARVREFGAPSTVDIVRAKLEINVGDRLRPAPDTTLPAFMPRSPGKALRGAIVSVQGGVSDFAQYAIVAINRGARDGVEPGHVLASVRKGRSLGLPRAGRPSLAAELLGIRDEDIVAIPPIPETVFPWASKAEDKQTPDERNGIVLVFKTFDRLSYAMVMKSTRPISVGDLVTTP